MPSKRKRASTSDRGPLHKRAKGKLSFDTLPAEIIDQVLSYVLPDPRNFDWGRENDDGNQLFVHPILQVSTTLRQRGLKIINNRCVWVRIQSFDLDRMDLRFDPYCELPLLPDEFWNFVPVGSPTLHLKFGTDPLSFNRPWTRSSSRSWPELVPFNFALFYKISQMILDLLSKASHGEGGSLQIEIENFGNDTSREIYDLILTALHFMPKMPRTVLERDDTTQLVKKIGIHPRKYSWNLDKLAEKATDVLQQVTSQRKAGRIDESAVMLLGGCAWLMIEAEKLLPSLDNGDFREDNSALTVDQMIDSPDQCRKGNLLRQTLFEVENRACHALVDLIETYGSCSCRRASWPDPEFRFLEGWNFTWLGLSMSHMARLHYGRALLHDAIGRSEYDDKYHIDDDESSSDSECENAGLDLGAVDLRMALFLEPDNDTYKDLYKSYQSRRGPRWVKWVEHTAEHRFVVVEDHIGRVKNKRIIWAGDWELIENRGAFEAVRQWLQLLEKGLEADQTIDEWFHMTVPPRKRKLFIQRSRRREKYWDDLQERRHMTGPLW